MTSLLSTHRSLATHVSICVIELGHRWFAYLRANSRFAPSQWETALLCNDVSHWLGASLESALYSHDPTSVAFESPYGIIYINIFFDNIYFFKCTYFLIVCKMAGYCTQIPPCLFLAVLRRNLPRQWIAAFPAPCLYDTYTNVDLMLVETWWMLNGKCIFVSKKWIGHCCFLRMSMIIRHEIGLSRAHT